MPTAASAVSPGTALAAIAVGAVASAVSAAASRVSTLCHSLTERVPFSIAIPQNSPAPPWGGQKPSTDGPFCPFAAEADDAGTSTPSCAGFGAEQRRDPRTVDRPVVGKRFVERGL